MTERGFSLVELLIACALLVAIGGVIAAVAGPMRHLAERALASAEIAGGRRSALEMLVAELREAGSDARVTPPGERLASVVPPVWLTADLDSEAFVTPGGAVRITRIPSLAAQAVLQDAVDAGENVLPLETTSRCWSGPPSCGLQVGAAVVLYGATSARLTIAGAGNGLVAIEPPLPSPVAAGAVVAEVSQITYGVRSDPDGARRLVRVTAAGAEQPVLDNVVDFEVTVDSDDVRRIRQVAVRLRLEAASAALRGPAGVLFRRAGTAGSARHWLPDSEIRVSVALRNPAGAS